MKSVKKARNWIRRIVILSVLLFMGYLIGLGVNHDVLPRYAPQQNVYEDEKWYLSFERHYASLCPRGVIIMLKYGEYPSYAALTACYKPAASTDEGNMMVEMILYKRGYEIEELLPSHTLTTPGGYYYGPLSGGWREYMVKLDKMYRLPVPIWRMTYCNGDFTDVIEIKMAFDGK